MLTDTPSGPAPKSTPSQPKLRLPLLSCDSHCHIFGPFDRFPLPADRSFTPHETPETALRELHDALGITRAVVVHSQGQRASGGDPEQAEEERRLAA
jgi:predicted TIM-barrel fold metal-dependent hydrolase